MSLTIKQNGKANRRLRLGMVGGGPGGFIGAVHRIAARLDDRFELVAAALSSAPDSPATTFITNNGNRNDLAALA